MNISIAYNVSSIASHFLLKLFCIILFGHSNDIRSVSFKRNKFLGKKEIKFGMCFVFIVRNSFSRSSIKLLVSVFSFYYIQRNCHGILLYICKQELNVAEDLRIFKMKRGLRFLPTFFTIKNHTSFILLLLLFLDCQPKGTFYHFCFLVATNIIILFAVLSYIHRYVNLCICFCNCYI